ncbi:DUF488 family protein [uncultured Draconibacterium sp.]|uniref:DUF488 domain-containing protein n=1 Tax=uncultured Draconibacterium sp. TaxID=1573823 RepID=UPI0029C6AC4E|nr:DUF488 family protein [uncultured Draconibacterium sp.]
MEVFDGQLTAKSLQKYLFLFTRRQTKKAYDFIPYRYGCFSFHANQDLATMQKYGYVEIVQQDSGRFIRLKERGDYLSKLTIEDRQLMLETKENFGKLKQTDLIRYTYQKFPYYATKSAIANKLLSKEELLNVEKQKRSFDEKTLFSIGYEGISLEAYINKLIINDVRVLCDVRKNAFSQKYGFSKSQLKTACEGVGISYIHIPELGIISEKRKELKSQRDYDVLFDEYERTSLKDNHDALVKVREMLEKEKRLAVTCFEKNPAQCHRTRVANALLKLPDSNFNLKKL